MRNLISGDDTAGCDPLTGEVHAQGLPQERPRQCPTAALPQDDHHAALAAAIAQSPPVDPLLAQVGRPDMSFERRPIDLALALETGLPRLRRHGLSQLVLENKGSLVLDVDISRELYGRQAFRGVDGQADRAEQVDEC